MMTGSDIPTNAALDPPSESLKDAREAPSFTATGGGWATVSQVSPTVLSPSPPMFHTGDGKIFLDISRELQGL